MDRERARGSISATLFGRTNINHWIGHGLWARGADHNGRGPTKWLPPPVRLTRFPRVPTAVRRAAKWGVRPRFSISFFFSTPFWFAYLTHNANALAEREREKGKTKSNDINERCARARPHGTLITRRNLNNNWNYRFDNIVNPKTIVGLSARDCRWLWLADVCSDATGGADPGTVRGEGEGNGDLGVDIYILLMHKGTAYVFDS